MGNIIAFDPSLSNTGVCVFDDAGNFLECLSIDTKREKTHPLKLKKIEKALIELRKKHKPSIIVAEQSFTRFNKSTQAIFKVVGVLQLVFYRSEQVFYHATSVRKEVMGKGNAKKEEMRNYISKKYDVVFEDYDQSDAFAVGICFFIRKNTED